MKKRKIVITLLSMIMLISIWGMIASAEPQNTPTATMPSASATPDATVTPLTTAEPTATPTADELLYKEIKAISEETNVGEKDETFTGNINVYMNWGTVGPLYSLLNIYQDLDKAKAAGEEPTKTFMWYERPQTIDYTKLPEHVVLMNVIDSKYDSGKNNADNSKKCMGFMMKVFETYPNAHYTLYTDDLRAQYEFLMMNYAGITNYNVIIESDGTASYSRIKEFYKGDKPTITENVISNLNTYNYHYSYFKDQISNKRVDPAFLSSNGAGSDYMYAQAKQEHVKYWIQWPEMVASDVDGMNDYLTNEYGINFVKKHHNEMYESLTETSKSDFMNAVLSAAMGSSYPENTDFKKIYDETYFSGYADESKKYMIISGTSTSGEGSSEKFEERVNNVIEYFGDDYVYLYKPHPRYPASEVAGRTEFLESKGITELPAQTPMETILWTYPKVSVGGYSSSLYMSATTKGQVKFFFAENGDSLGAPLPDLYKLGYFDDAVFFNPDVVIKPTEGVDMSYDDGTITFSENIDSGKLLAVQYDSSNCLENIKVYDVENSNTFALPENDVKEFNGEVSFMLWNNLQDMTPIANLKKVSFVEIVSKP